MSDELRSQREAIKRALYEGRALTQWDAANEFKCWRLGARVHELRKEEGLDIVTEWEGDGKKKRYARYRLAGPLQMSLAI